MPKHQEQEQVSINLLGEGTSIIGDINSRGDMRIDGTVTGNITSSGKVIIGPTGIIEGDVRCRNFDISGIFKGKIEVSEHTTLKETARFEGDLKTNKIAIEPGAIFSGVCQMERKSTDQKGDFKN